MKTVTLNEKEMRLIIEMFNQLNDSPNSRKLIYKISIALSKTPIKVASRKAKGRSLQNWAVEKIALLLGEKLNKDKDSNNIRGREMGQSGVDVWLHKSIRNKFPIAVECKAQEQIQINAFIEQAKNNTTNDLPYWLLIIKNKLIKNPIAVMDWELFEYLYLYKLKKVNE